MQPNKVKCKALEKVAMKKDSKSCKKSAINVGQTWWEEEGELWQTKEEAQKHLSKLEL
jgi:hypothetical protein